MGVPAVEVVGVPAVSLVGVPAVVLVGVPAAVLVGVLAGCSLRGSMGAEAIFLRWGGTGEGSSGVPGAGSGRTSLGGCPCPLRPGP